MLSFDFSWLTTYINQITKLKYGSLTQNWPTLTEMYDQSKTQKFKVLRSYLNIYLLNKKNIEYVNN